MRLWLSLIVFLLPAGASARAVEIAIGSSHACARLDDGTVRCWGLNRDGQVGDTVPVVASPETMKLPRKAVGITAGMAHSCAVLDDGSVRCWGAGSAAPKLVDAVEVRAGGRHTCARRASGTVVCWGANDRGQLGDLAGLGQVIALSAGARHTCALVAGGTVHCWGDNTGHEIDDSATEIHLRPVAVAGWRDVVQVAAGKRVTCARGRDRTVLCRGPEGRAYAQKDQVPGLLLPADASDLAVGAALGSEILHSDEFGGRTTFTACAVVAGGKVVCWNVLAPLSIRSEPAPERPAAIDGVEGAVRVAVGAQIACALLGNGSVRCWGDNTHGELGVGTPDTRMEPTVVAGLSGVAALALGSTHSCALMRDGSVRCWGDDAYGSLGLGGGRARAEPRMILGLAGVVEIAAGDYHNCARLRDGTVRCWGLDNAGQTSADPRTSWGSTGLVTVPVAGVDQITAAGTRSCARLRDGTVRCWGGMMPLQKPETTETPTRLTGVDGIADLQLGHHLGCVRYPAGEVSCWDDNALDERYQPTVGRLVAVPAFAGAAEVSVGFAHVCGLDRERRPLCYGDPTFGALGPGRVVPWNVLGPLADIARAAQVVAGNHTICALGEDGRARCFGLLAVEQGGVARVALGGTHACAMMRDGGVSCWGANLAGQSGWGKPRDPRAVVEVKL